MAIYIGEDPAIKTIPCSIYLDATVADRPVSGQLVPVTINTVRNHLHAYRTKNLDRVRTLEFNPLGLSRETTAIAIALGSCLVDAPQLQTELVALLRPRDQQQIADRSDGDEALVVNAALALCHQDRGEIYVKEIAAEANRLFVARGETRQLTPEKVGHRLKKVGLFTRRLSQVGNGLMLDQATKMRLHEVAAAYRGEDSIPEGGNPHCPLCQKDEPLREVI
jgi:hypothetical protein